MKQPKAIQIRRVSQIVFLLIFLVLFLQTKDPLRIAFPPDFLLRIDPLAGLITSLASRTIITAFWPAIIVLALAFLLGKSLCGWVCPLGTSLDIWNRIMPAGRRRGDRRWKYAILFGIMLLSLLSVQAAWLFDPLVIFTRTLSLSLYPLSVWGINSLLNAGLDIGFLEGIALWFWDLLQGWFLPLNQLQTALLFTTLVVFAAILLLDRFGRRTWCRVLCPLGALLGLIGHISPFGRLIKGECTECTLCEANCRMDAIDKDDFTKTRRSECILCMECSQACTEEATSFRWGKQEGGQDSLDITRRKALGVMGTSILFAGVWQTQLKNRSADGYLIRPPGAVEEDKFLDLCLRCEQCVKACSSTGGCLQPSGTEYGWSGFWTPRARMREGYCEYSCTLCGQVCPSGAIQPLTEEEKHKTVIGIAYIDRVRCIPWATGEDCIVCEEHCPTPEKAIKFKTAEDGSPTKLPYVDAELCIGCGICENKCPVAGPSAILVMKKTADSLF